MANTAPDRADIQQKIDSFDRWHYEFDLNGVKTPIGDPTRINRHRQRKRYFFDPLVDLFDGSLAGKRVLDLGCNAGFWSLAAIEAGAEYVLGIDGRQMHVDQANFVFDIKDVDRSRYDFVQGNIFEYDFSNHGVFDVVLCLGLMYHISKHVQLLEIIDAVNDDLLLIDTALSLAPGSYMRVHRESTDSPRNTFDYEIVMSPTQQALADMVGQFGYSVEVLKPRFSDWKGSPEYKFGQRKAFVCAKKSDLRTLSVPTERIRRRPRPGDLYFLSRRQVKRAKRSLRK
ncbi:MAG: DUF1698 domain-containing protein [Actinomycetota bacterium]|nr:DUF1698 domain-containing protein [Actinomycetota bacterium]